MMKNAKAMFAAITLGLILSSVTLAGDVATPGYVPPPPPPAALLQEDQTDAADVDSSSFAIDLLIAALGAYY
jgi:hypothetical protein